MPSRSNHTSANNVEKNVEKNSEYWSQIAIAALTFLIYLSMHNSMMFYLSMQTFIMITPLGYVSFGLALFVISTTALTVKYKYWEELEDKDKIQQKRYLAAFLTFILGSIVALTTAGGVISPTIAFITLASLKIHLLIPAIPLLTTSAIYYLTGLIFIAILPAWFATYALTQGGMWNLFVQMLGAKEATQHEVSAQIEASKQSWSERLVYWAIGIPNAFLANGPGLVLGAIGLYSLAINIFSITAISISMKFGLIIAAYLAGVGAAAALTANSLVATFKLFKEYASNKDKNGNNLDKDSIVLNYPKIVLSVVTGAALAAFNYKAGIQFIPGIMQLTGIAIPAQLAAALSTFFGLAGFGLTIIAATCLLIKLNQGIKKKTSNITEEKTEIVNNKEIANVIEELNKATWKQILIGALKMIGAIVGAILVQDALLTIPATWLIPLAGVFFISSIIGLICLAKQTKAAKNKIEGYALLTIGLLLSIVALTMAILPAFGIYNIIGVTITTWILAITAATTFIDGFYGNGYEHCVFWATLAWHNFEINEVINAYNLKVEGPATKPEPEPLEAKYESVEKEPCEEIRTLLTNAFDLAQTIPTTK